ncbi:TPA: class Ib ribonucleoside-diphosphate reductase assembly flavoprotein NrdI [Staphylococcus delphini]|nr:class Ib ribonucleoside-diphosphate reductase assembly flavoprotein NrdI [Staphylococcus delphini]
MDKDILVVYYTYTGKTEVFAKELRAHGIRTLSIDENSVVNEPFILVTPTYSFGEVPETVLAFLNNNGNNLKAVMSSGNRNWGGNFAIAGDIVSKTYGVQLIGKFEMNGNKDDVEKLVSYIKGGDND